jgi:hypothetical protein
MQSNVLWDWGTNGKAKYKMKGTRLEEVIEERDLGVIMRNDI